VLRFLLDTHALLWLFTDDRSLSDQAFGVISDPTTRILVSAVSAWEIATKFRLGKLPMGQDLVQDFRGYLDHVGLYEYPLSVEHGISAGSLPGVHKDPFDRMLAAQCQAESIPIISDDRVFDLYGVRRVW
jgi:PIN domain nuclease of toxin-antitoxin system